MTASNNDQTQNVNGASDINVVDEKILTSENHYGENEEQPTVTYKEFAKAKSDLLECKLILESVLETRIDPVLRALIETTLNRVNRK